MKVANLPLTLLKVENKTGTGKTSGKAYDFHTATVVDEDANVFTFNLADEVVASNGKETLASLRNVRVVASVNFKPKGFDIGGTITGFDLEGEE